VRILHVLPGLDPGGMEKLVIELTADAARRGDNVAVASGPGAWVSKIALAGGAHVPLPATSRTSPIKMMAAAALLALGIRRLRPDIVHSHNVRATVVARAALAAARHRAVLMPTLHGLHPDDYAAAGRTLRRMVPRVIACAPSVARSLEAAGVQRCRIDIITNGAVLEPAGRTRREELRQRLRLGPEPLVLGVGRLVEQKNWPAFIVAASRVDGPSFAVAGDGPLRPALEDLARRAGRRVRFLGPVDDIAALVGLSSCVVSTSSWEGLPLAVLEALSLGAPVVATAVDGVTDLVPAEAALLVPPHDPTAIATAVSRILADADLARRLSKSALAAASAWHPGQMLELYRNAYRAASDDQFLSV